MRDADTDSTNGSSQEAGEGRVSELARMSTPSTEPTYATGESRRTLLVIRAPRLHDLS